jgi:hypothetical protein
MSEEKKYVLEITERQLSILIDATEILARIGMGQFWTIIEHIVPKKPFAKYWEELPTARDILTSLGARMLDYPENASPGIHNPIVADKHQIAWDLHQVLRNRLAWDRHPEGGMQTQFDDPLLSSKEPLAKVRQL